MTTTLDQRLAAVRGIMFDVDGCLVLSDAPSGQGGAAIRGAEAFIEQMRESGRRLCAFTNGTAQHPHDIAAHLRHLGIDIADEEMLTPAVSAARHLVRVYGDAPILAYGGDGVIPVLKDRGVNVIEPADHATGGASGVAAVVVGWDPDFTKSKLQFAAEAILGGAELYCTSDAKAFASQERLNVGVSGFIAAGLSHVTGRAWTVLGKPSAYAFDTVLETLGTTPQQTLVLGDDLYLDAGMALAGGALAGLVLTGLTDRATVEDAGPDETPDLVLESLAELGILVARADERAAAGNHGEVADQLAVEGGRG